MLYKTRQDKTRQDKTRQANYCFLKFGFGKRNFFVSLFAFLFLSLFLFKPTPAYATTTLEVGSGQTYTTIQTAVDAIPSTLTDSYVINIHAGTYTSASNPIVNIASKTTSTTNTITLQANGSDTVILDGQDARKAIVANVNNVTIKGLQIKSGNDHGILLGTTSCDNDQILNNYFYTTTIPGDFRGLTIIECNNVTVRNNTFYGYGVNAIWNGGADNTIIDGNTLYSDGSDAILINTFSTTSNNVIVKNNIISGPCGGGTCASSYGVNVASGSSATLSNNDVYNYGAGSFTGSYTDGGGNITTNPSFLSTNSSSGNFLYIDPTSAAYAAGVGGIPMGGRYVATPASLGQFMSNGSSQISIGGSTNDKSFILKGNLASSMYTDSLTPEIEVKATNTAFNGSSTTLGNASSYSGSAVTNSTTFNCLSKNSYHWRMRISNSVGVQSNWVAFGGNADGVNSDTDFSINNGCTVGLTLDNNPQGAPNGKTRLSGKAVLTDSSYTISSVEYSVNGGGWNGATAKDGSFNSTSEEFYFDFDQKSNQPKDSSGNLIDGYTIQVRSTNSNGDVTDNLFYFQPFNLNSPQNNASSSSSYPSFDFRVSKQRTALKNNLSKYQVQVKKGGSDNTTSWTTLIDNIPIDFSSVQTNSDNLRRNDYVGKDPNNGNGVYETSNFTATYSNDSSEVSISSKTTPLSGSYQWKVTAVDKAGHSQDSDTRFLRVNTNQTVASSNYFPLAILNISGLGNPNISTTNPTAIKTIYYLNSLTPIFYGIAYVNAKVTLSLTDQGCDTTKSTDCIKTYSSITNQESRYGINVPKGDLQWGKKYTTNMSVAYNQDYNELPQFTLSTAGYPVNTQPIPTPEPQTVQNSQENTTQQPSPIPTPTPQPARGAPETVSKKNCFLFICW